MSESRLDSDPLIEEATSAVRKVVEKLPPGVAEIRIGHAADREEVVSILVTPSSGNAARILVEIDVAHDWVFVTLGRLSTFELEPSLSRDESLTARLVRLCEAAVEGRFRETIWVKKGKVIKSEGVATIGERKVRSVWRHIAIVRGSRKLETIYQPYS